MATIPVFRTWVAGEVVTAAEMNSNIRDSGNFFLARPYCNVYNNTGVSAATSALTLIPWDTEVEDNDAMHSTVTNPSRIICATPGVYLFHGAVSWNANNALINRVLTLRLNSAGASGGGTFLNRVDSASASTGAASLGNSSVPSLTYLYRFANVGDYVEMFVEQASGGTVTTTAGNPTYFQALWELA